MITPQSPIASPFKATSTAAEVIHGINLTGRTAIVTGGYSGLGLETVRALTGAGAKVVVPARDRQKAEQALAGFSRVEVALLDLMDPASIDAFADGFLGTHDRLDIMVNNAAIMAAPLARDALGHESQFSTNVLGHFRLTCRLWPALRAAGSARVVVLSSANHRAPVSALLHDPDFRRREYDPWIAYAQSKAANALFARALDRIGATQGVRAFSVHPGGIYETGLLRHTPSTVAEAAGMIDALGQPIIDPERNGFKSVPQGAATTVWAATSPLLEGKGGVYCADCNIGTLLDADDGPWTFNGIAPSVADEVSAGRLWQLCETLTGCRID